MDQHDSARNHLLWIGPVIAIPGLLSYFVLFSRWPFFRDTAWLNIAILLGAVAISAVGLMRAWPRGALQRVLGILGVAFSGSLAAGLVAYCFVLSYELPSASESVALGEKIPAITLANYDGQMIDLADAARGPLVLVFYRGIW